MRNRCIDADDEIESIDDRRRVCKLQLLGDSIVDVGDAAQGGSLLIGYLLLQDDELRIESKERPERLKRHIAGIVDRRVTPAAPEQPYLRPAGRV